MLVASSSQPEITITCAPLTTDSQRCAATVNGVRRCGVSNWAYTWTVDFYRLMRSSIVPITWRVATDVDKLLEYVLHE